MKRLLAGCLCLGIAFIGCGKQTSATYNGKTVQEVAKGLEPGNKTQTKTETILALYEMADKGNDLEAVAILANAVKDSTMEVRLTAIKFLGRLGPKAAAALPALKSAKEEFLEKDPPTAVAADTAISEIEAKPEGAPAAAQPAAK
jgi:hypothetical protein